jgi:hypothetical protein
VDLKASIDTWVNFPCLSEQPLISKIPGVDARRAMLLQASERAGSLWAQPSWIKRGEYTVPQCNRSRVLPMVCQRM